MLSSPRRPSNTMRIFSSAEYCLRVARRMSWTTFSAGSLDDRVCCLIFAPCERYDEPETLPSSICQFCLTSADGGHSAARRGFQNGSRRQRRCASRNVRGVLHENQRHHIWVVVFLNRPGKRLVGFQHGLL